MLGLMQDRQLMISDVLVHAARHHAMTEIVSRTESGAIHRTTYAETERRARRLARALTALGIGSSDRVGTLAWNGFRHLELYYAVSGSEAICHTINPRLSPDDIVFIINHAQDRILFADPDLAPLVAAVTPRIVGTVRSVVFMAEADEMPDVALPSGIGALCYESLLQDASEDYTWPVFSEQTAASLCYTSGTTGQPKGVLYSHRSTVLHALTILGADAFALRAVDRVLPVVPMFHVHAWGLPYAAPMAGTALVLPGRHLDGPSLAALMNAERVTVTAGVPTVWMALLQHLRDSGTRLETVQRLYLGGTACPRHLMEAFEHEYGIPLHHGWGMTETSPVVTQGAPKPASQHAQGEERWRVREKQGRALFGVDIAIVDDDGRDLPWDGETRGRLCVRGPWVSSAYFGSRSDEAVSAEWLDTGDIATIDSEGYVAIVDRFKDVIKSGGEWIGSVQLENLAASHPAVAEAAAIAARHPKWQERPLLLIVLRPGQDVSKAEMLRLFESRVPKWWVPDDVLVVETLPHTATGKLNKRALRARFGDYLMSPCSTQPAPEPGN